MVSHVLHCRGKVLYLFPLNILYLKTWFPYNSCRGAMYQWIWDLPEDTGAWYRTAATQCCHLYRLAMHPLW